MYYFIVNPNSRSGRGRSIWNEIHQQLMLRGIDFQYCLTRYSGHAAEIASDACALGTESEPVYIIAVGGDGTIHEVLTGITDFDRVVFGYIPTGSGNDFCRSMRLPFDPMESLEYILKAEHISKRMFLTCSAIIRSPDSVSARESDMTPAYARRFWQRP